jgi:outer membrane protein insertion porin family
VPGGASYSEGATGTQLRFGKQLSPYVTLSTSLRVEEDDLTGLPKYGHPDLIRQAGTHLVISNTWRIERDTRDNRRDAVSGSKHSLSATLAGFGGDYNFYRLEHESTWYKGLGEDKKWVLSFRMREGIVRPYGGSDYVPLQDRMFAGGTDTIRGYKTRWVGPRAREYVYWGKYFALGGDMRAITNLELKYKVTKILRLYSFLDGGGVWDFDNIDFGTARASVGVGIGFDVPRLGPIRVDIGYPLNPDKNQGRSPHLHLLTGFRF